MRWIIFVMMALILVNIAMADEKYYSLELNYYDEIITYRDINLLTGTAPEIGGEGSYTLKLISFYNTILDEFNFDVQAQEYMGMKESKDFTLYIPYNKEIEEIVIFEDRDRIFGYNVASFADVCGDRICQSHESYESCKEDCHSGMQDDYCDMQVDGKCDADCSAEMDVDCAGKPVVEPEVEEEPRAEERIIRKEEVKEQENEVSLLYYIIPVLLIVIIIIALMHFLSKGKVKKQNGERLSRYISDNLRKGYGPEQIKKVLLGYGYSREDIDKLLRKFHSE